MSSSDFSVETAISTLLDEDAIGSEAFETQLRLGGKELAGYLNEGATAERVVAVVTSAQDRDFVAAGVIESLIAESVTVSTLWHKYFPATGFVSAASMMVAQHHDNHPKHVDQLIYLCSSIAEDATIADSLSRISGILKAQEVILCTFTASTNELESLKAQFLERSSQMPRPVILEGLVSLALPARADKIWRHHRQHLKKAYGKRSIAYVPQALGGPGPNYVSGYEASAPGI